MANMGDCVYNSGIQLKTGECTMPGLTTHILDLANGHPAAGVEITLYRVGIADEEIMRAVTNVDGRCPEPLLSAADMQTGTYRLEFHIGDYFKAQGVMGAGPAFLDVVPVVFGISDTDAHYHVPLLVSPYGYSTYRGS